MEFFKANPDIMSARFFMEQMEDPHNRKVMAAMFPSLPTNLVIQVPKLQESITLDNVMNLPEYENW